VEAHPLTADAYDSLADGLLAAGDQAGARRAYEQLLSVLPRDTSLDGTGKSELRKSTEEKLKGLSGK